MSKVATIVTHSFLLTRHSLLVFTWKIVSQNNSLIENRCIFNASLLDWMNGGRAVKKLEIWVQNGL